LFGKIPIRNLHVHQIGWSRSPGKINRVLRFQGLDLGDFNLFIHVRKLEYVPVFDEKFKLKFKNKNNLMS